MTIPAMLWLKRLLRHQDELFQFIVRDGVSANNNLAERTLRPLVVIRKISGGTRSDKAPRPVWDWPVVFENLARARPESIRRVLSTSGSRSSQTSLPNAEQLHWLACLTCIGGYANIVTKGGGTAAWGAHMH